MIIYNVTIKINWSIHEDWFLWMKEIHIPEILSTNCFTHYKMLRLLDIDEVEGPTYAVQYFASNIKSYQNYIEFYSGKLRDDGMKKWGNQFIAFRSLMQIVN